MNRDGGEVIHTRSCRAQGSICMIVNRHTRERDARKPAPVALLDASDAPVRELAARVPGEEGRMFGLATLEFAVLWVLGFFWVQSRWRALHPVVLATVFLFLAYGFFRLCDFLHAGERRVWFKNFDAREAWIEGHLVEFLEERLRHRDQQLPLSDPIAAREIGPIIERETQRLRAQLAALQHASE